MLSAASSNTNKRQRIAVEWFFDLVSPFTYLQLYSLEQLPPQIQVIPRPVLLAGLLKHRGQLGPAEISSKRLHTYRLCHWLATSRGVPFRMPPTHPFNPLRPLRLLVAVGAGLSAVRTAFEIIYAEGRDPNQAETWTELARRLDVDNPDALAESQAAKDELRCNTELAIAAGVFGVPTFRLYDELFWGNDTLKMMLDFYHDPGLFRGDEMLRLATLPVGVERRRDRGQGQ